jgi:hypothetical protein
MNKDQLIEELKLAGATEDQIAECSNNDERKELLDKLKSDYEIGRVADSLGMTLDELKAQMKAELLDEIQAEQAVKDAKISDVGPAETFDMKAYMKERVPFQAFSDADKYKDDIVVTVNGVKTVIQRGVVVMITREVYQAIDIAERQKAAANAYSLKLENEYKARVDANMM